MVETAWRTDAIDLDGYLARIGVPARPPSREALAELNEAHMRTFSFDNIDVLLGQHPGVSLDAVQTKFVGRGRGGYCFEHSTLFAAALDALGYQVRRHLGRVGDPANGTLQGRTHMVVEIALDGLRLLADPGFGMSTLRPIPLVDGAEDEYLGWRYRVGLSQEWVWQLQRYREDRWEVMHNTDELLVLPADTAIGHHYTSTYPGSHFTQGLVLARFLPDRHVTVTTDAVTIRRPGQPTEHRELRDGELADRIAELEVPLTSDEQDRLITRVEELRSRS